MSTPKNQPPQPDTEGGPESLLPGERWGEGSRDLWKHMERDEQRKAGHESPRKKKSAGGEDPSTPQAPPADEPAACDGLKPGDGSAAASTRRRSNRPAAAARSRR